MTTAFDQLADRILSGGAATAEDAVAVLRTPDAELMTMGKTEIRKTTANFDPIPIPSHKMSRGAIATSGVE